MTGYRWLDQIALAWALSPGAHVVAADPMAFPFLALRPGVRFDPVPPAAYLQPAQGGIIVRDRVGPGTRAPEARLAVARQVADAADLGRRIWGAGAFLVSDGALIEGAGQSVPGAIRTALIKARDAALRADPLTLLRQTSLEGEVGVLATGDAVVWFDPLFCLRGLDRNQARRVALAGAPRAPEMILRLPGGRTRLEFEAVRARPAIKLHCGAEVSWLAAGSAEVDTSGSGAITTDVILRCNGARLARIGLVVPALQSVPAAEKIDPLEVYADPINADYMS